MLSYNGHNRINSLLPTYAGKTNRTGHTGNTVRLLIQLIPTQKDQFLNLLISNVI